MKPEDQKAFEQAYKIFRKKYHRDDTLISCAEVVFKAALAHRDAQPAVAVNEQMLEALKRLEKAAWNVDGEHVNGLCQLTEAAEYADIAIRAAEAEKAKGGRG